ncbi:MAG: HAD-IC family P-type ATPase [Acidobacteria bacterium]|nr:HAD-IC family P-type ATPase [Acidobacteriota bacterium]
MAEPHQLSIEESLAAQGSDAAGGLSEEEARRRLEERGPNELTQRRGKSRWKILAEQLSETLILALIAAAVVSAALGDVEDAVAILAIVGLNAWLGVRQEYKAEQAMAALMRMAQPSVRVRRGGHVTEAPAREIVPGDVVLLEAGAIVPADGRLLEAANLRIQESALTGESEPVEKDACAVLDEQTALGDRRNMAYRGSEAVYGRGELLVTATGMGTELGRIAELIQDAGDVQTPLQKRLDHLGKALVLVALVIVSLVFVEGLWRGGELRLMFLTAVSLAVAAAPEGLPAVVTIALALGAQRMLDRQALIRKLPAVETLGSVTVICSDKTGTLTQNRMSVERIELPGRAEAEEGAPAELLLLAAAALCNDAVLERDESGDRTALGDPTEAALALAAEQAGLPKPDLDARAPRVAEAPFDSDRKRMTTVHELRPDGPLQEAWSKLLGAAPDLKSASHAAFAKGAVESLLEVAAHVLENGRIEPLDEARKQAIRETHDQLASQGMRVLGYAYKALGAEPAETAAETLEQELVYLGLTGMIDPPRPEVREAVEQCRSAGVRTMMITGDHPATAAYIAEQLGVGEGGALWTGADLDGKSDQELEEIVDKAGVYARVSPEHKLRIVAALQRRGQIVAMTGDGVNDAPALKRADIGVAMGLTGSDVAREAADMVLRDDNFATIVAAVEEGRIIFDNIRKFIRYLLSANCGELLVMFFGPLLGMPIPLLPLQILWMNLVTDGPPALALGVEPAERNTMQRPPYAPGESVFSRGVGRDILGGGGLMGLVALGLGWRYWSLGLEQWQTVLFTTLTLSQMALALATRSERESVFTMNPASNWYLYAAVGASTALQLGVVYWPAAQSLFQTTPLSWEDLGVCLAASTAILWAAELEKLIKRSKRS